MHISGLFQDQLLLKLCIQNQSCDQFQPDILVLCAFRRGNTWTIHHVNDHWKIVHTPEKDVITKCVQMPCSNWSLDITRSSVHIVHVSGGGSFEKIKVVIQWIGHGLTLSLSRESCALKNSLYFECRVDPVWGTVCLNREIQHPAQSSGPPQHPKYIVFSAPQNLHCKSTNNALF